jgi:hypothetical protein
MYKKLLRASLSILPLVVCAVTLHGQDIDTLWTKTYGGLQNEEAYAVEVTDDGGYIIAGYSDSYGAGYSDAYLVRTDADGETLWTHWYGGDHSDIAQSVVQTEDGGFIFLGWTYSFGGGIPANSNVYLMKTDSLGQQSWKRVFGDSIETDKGYCVKQSSDGGYYISGYTVTTDYIANIYLIRTDENGHLLWSQTYGRGRAYDFDLTEDGGVILACVYMQDYKFIKTDADGDVIWESDVFGGPGRDDVFEIQQTPDGGYLVSGFYTNLSEYITLIYLVRLDENGNTVWTRDYGRGRAYCFDQTDDGGAVLACVYMQDFKILQVDPDGNLIAESAVYGGSGRDDVWAIRRESDDLYVIAGFTESFGSGGRDVWLIKALVTDLGICGDANMSGDVTTADAYFILNYLGSGPQPPSCWIANTDGWNGITPSDAYVVFEFLGGGTPPMNCQPCEFSEQGTNTRME